MKIIIVIIAFFMLMYAGCYDSDNDATIRINLGNLHAVTGIEGKSYFDKILNLFSSEAYAQTAPADLMTLHFGIYNGRILIDKRSISINYIPASQVVEFTVPAGINRTILVVGENTSNEAGYYGFNTVDLVEGKTSYVNVNLTAARWDGSVTMNNLTRQVTSNPTCGPAPYHITWTPGGVSAMKYLIIDTSSAPIIKYSGYGSEYDDNVSNNYFFYVEFEDFNLRTSGDSLNNC